MQKTLLADQGEIRVGCKYQAEIPDRLAEGQTPVSKKSSPGDRKREGKQGSSPHRQGAQGLSRVPKTGSLSTCTSSQSDFLPAFRGNTHFPPSFPNTSFSPPFPGTGSKYLSHSRGSHCISPYGREVRKPWVSSFPLCGISRTLAPPLHLLNKCMQAKWP